MSSLHEVYSTLEQVRSTGQASAAAFMAARTLMEEATELLQSVNSTDTLLDSPISEFIAAREGIDKAVGLLAAYPPTMNPWLERNGMPPLAPIEIAATRPRASAMVGASALNTTVPSQISAAAIADKANRSARENYPSIAELRGLSAKLLPHMPRLVLRKHTPYPYSFTETDSFYPDDEQGFGRLIRATRQEGFEEIHAAIGQQAKERQWLFLPAADVWIDTTVTPKEMSVEGDDNLLLFLSADFDKIESLHTHPDQVIRKAASNNPEAFSENLLLEGACPSSNDLQHDIQMHNRLAAEATLTEHIASHYGITTYTLDPLLGRRPNTLYSSRRFEWRILYPVTDTTAAIRRALGNVSANQFLHEGQTPVFECTFQPLILK